MVKLSTPVSELYGIGPKFLTKVNKLGIETVSDLLRHLPFRYEDYSATSLIDDISPGQVVTITGMVTKTVLRRSWKKNMAIVEAHITDGSGDIKAVWFNQPYIKNALIEGRQFNFSGKVNSYQGEMTLSNPMYEAFNIGGTKHTGRLVPIYPETRGITSKGLRYIIKPILEDLEEMTDPLPDSVLDKYELPDINESVRFIHFPTEIEEAEKARKRFAFEELFLLSLVNLQRKVKLAQKKSIAIPLDVNFMKAEMKKLPFELTTSQKKCLFESLQDMEKPTPMNRLLQGDVGSGKTIVAGLATLNAAKNGHQTAFMAPTEILARQHYETLIKIFAKNSFPIALITGSNKGRVFWEEGLESEVSKKDLKKKIADGNVHIIVGTHALIQKDSEFKNLGLVVIDEQHRFGVEQRAQLAGTSKDSKDKKIIPHFLSMSATPIPRTLTLTIFGDLNLSIIDELPMGRKEIKTSVVSPSERDKSYKFIKDQVKQGRQVFVICPRIEKEEDEHATHQWDLPKLELKNVKEEYEKLSEKVFPDLRVSMLHGKMKPKEKEQVMGDFKDGKSDILVSTSVVEVGVDIPNATIMMIESAERFGLSQLYQFRGRVGRGKHQSYCFLFTDSESNKTGQRLTALVKAKNGFELAEQDLAIRGPGQFLGTRQTGVPDTAMRSLSNLSIIKDVREAAVELIKSDPLLSKHTLLKKHLENFKKTIHEE